MSSTYRQSLESWLSQLEVSAEKVVDIGGSQLPVKGRTKSWDVQEYLIADLPNPHVGSPKPDLYLDLNSSKPLNPSGKVLSSKKVGQEIFVALDIYRFDIIFCLEVFDYVYNPIQALEHIYQLLEKSGTAWVSFPAFYPHHQPLEHDALNYKEYGIRKLAEAVGLEIMQMIPRRPTTNALQAYFAAEGLRAAKGYDHAVMGWIVEFKK